MLIFCNNKGCGKETEAKLELSKDDKGNFDFHSSSVVCDECNRVIEGIPYFTKVSLSTLGQTRKEEKSQKSFTITCASCKKNDRPTIQKNELFCPKCKALHQNVPAAYKKVLMDFLPRNK